jgi:hypothetical protein
VGKADGSRERAPEGVPTEVNMNTGGLRWWARRKGAFVLLSHKKTHVIEMTRTFLKYSFQKSSTVSMVAADV